MRIEIKGRNTPVSDDLREHVERALRARSRSQVSELAQLEVELSEERNPAIAEPEVAEATLHLKGVTLRARDARRDMIHSINLCADQLARQVKRHRDKRRKRRATRACAAGRERPRARSAPADWPEAPLSARRREGCDPAAAAAATLGRMSTHRPRPAHGRGQAVQDATRSASRASTSSSPSWSCSRTTSCAQPPTRCASARAARAASRSTTCSTSPSRSSARPASARSACATSTSR